MPTKTRRSERYRQNLRVWEKNRQYFHAHKAEIVRKYRGKYVAIWEGAVIDSDRDKGRLAERVYSTIGYKPVFFTRATEHVRVVHVPSYIHLGKPLTSRL